MPSLVTLRYVAILMVLGCVALSIGTTVVECVTLTAFRLKVSTGLDAPKITLNFIVSAFYVRELVLDADGWVPMTPSIVTRNREYLSTAANAFSTLVRTSLDATSTLGDSWRYLTPTVSVAKNHVSMRVRDQRAGAHAFLRPPSDRRLPSTCRRAPRP